MAFPVSFRSELSDPRAPTTTRPLRQLRDISGRHRRIYPRIADQGALTPIAGVPVTVDGDTIPGGGVPRSLEAPTGERPGGIPTIYPGSLPGQRGTPIARLTSTLSAKLQNDVRKREIIRSLRGRLKSRVRLGPSSIDLMQGVRVVPDAPLKRRDLIFDVVRRRERGTPYDKLAAPASVWSRLFRERAAVNRGQRVGLFARLKAARFGGLMPDETKPLGDAGRMAAGDARALGDEFPTAAIDEPGNGGGAGDGVERLLLFGGVIVLAVVLFRGRR